MLRRLNALREHHTRCARRYDREAAEINQRTREETLKVIQMIKKNKEKQQEDLEICATEESLSDSSHDLDSDYAPSSPDCSKDEEDTPKKKIKETMVAQEEHKSYSADTEGEDEEDEVALSTKAGDVQDAEVSQSCAEVSEDSLEQAQDMEVQEPDVLTQRTTAPGPPATDKVTKKSSKRKRSKRPCDSAEDSDEEPDVLTQRTTAPGPSATDKVTKKAGFSKEKKKKKKKEKKLSEPAEDSDEDPVDDILSQKTSTSTPSDEVQVKKKMGTDELSLKQSAFKRRPWSSGEKAAIRRQLGQYITLHRVPGKEECIKALDKEPVLRTRSWKDVKNQVYNCITAHKRKQL